MAKKRRTFSRRPRILFKKGIVASIIKFIVGILPLALILLAIALTVKVAATFIFDSDYFKVKNIRIIGERLNTGLSSDITKVIRKGANIFSLDIKAFEEAIGSRHPELKGIRVRRVMPDTLEINYDTRKPFCQIDSGEFYLVSDDGVVLPNPLPAALPGLVVITGIDMPQRYVPFDKRFSSKPIAKAVSLLKEVNESGFSDSRKVARIDIGDQYNPALFLGDGTRIEIGEYHFKEKQRILEEILNDLESRKKQAKVIDLRFKNVAVIPR